MILPRQIFCGARGEGRLKRISFLASYHDMVGGTLLQLDARGPLNHFLSGSPSASLFRAAFRRHTHFALEHIDVLPRGNPDWGQTFQFVIPRNGDLLTDAFLRIPLPEVRVEESALNWCHHVGYALLEYAELYVGATRIEYLPGEWLYLASRLLLPENKRNALDFMVGETGTLQTPSERQDAFLLMIPLTFWFSRNPAHALPMVALSCEEVTVRVKLRAWQDVLQVQSLRADAFVPPLPSPSLVIQMAYLEREERETFSKRRIVQVLEQVEVVEARGLKTNGTVDLTSFHGCSKQLWVVFQREQAISRVPKIDGTTPDYNDFGNYVSDPDRSEGSNMIRALRLQLNGLDYSIARDPQFYNVYMPFRHHTSMPPTGVFVLPFCLEPENVFPTGSLYLDALDDVRLAYEGNARFQSGATLCRVFSTRYNVLEIVPDKGQARLLFQ